MMNPATSANAMTATATMAIRLRLTEFLLEVDARARAWCRGCFRRSEAVPFGIEESAMQSSARRLRGESTRKRPALTQAPGARQARQHAAGQSLLRRGTKATAARPRAARPRGA